MHILRRPRVCFLSSSSSLCMYFSVYVYVYVHIFMCVCVFVCTYTHTHTYIYSYLSTLCTSKLTNTLYIYRYMHIYAPAAIPRSCRALVDLVCTLRLPLYVHARKHKREVFRKASPSRKDRIQYSPVDGCMYVCMYVCVHVCMHPLRERIEFNTVLWRYVCMYVCMHICILTATSRAVCMYDSATFCISCM